MAPSSSSLEAESASNYASCIRQLLKYLLLLPSDTNPGTLTLKAERQSAQMSKITNDTV